ncbi:MAG: DMT family transporter, partial [Kiritimatiellae bacterium]|nr:DMT family transporter [Kiritimatiellia bacterium]
MTDPSAARAAGNGGIPPKGAARDPGAGSRTAGLALAALTVCVWGVTFVSTKALLADFSALEILVLRYLVAWAVLWAIHPRRMGALRLRDEALFAAAGLAGATAYQMLENLAIHFTNASNVSILVATAPLFAAGCSRLFLGERALSRRFLAGCALALVGVALVALGGVRGL